jgi:large subunit ribosomal protein L15
MKLDEILSAAGKYKKRTRVGRGSGSGKGKTSGRGSKGYHSRAGSGRDLGFEGGQNPMLARIPKRGFNNYDFRTEYEIVNVGELDARFEDGARVDAASLAEARLIRDVKSNVKILAGGELTKKLTVAATKFSKAAAEKIEKAGGAVETL